jgi:hypothetical protein
MDGTVQMFHTRANGIAIENKNDRAKWGSKSWNAEPAALPRKPKLQVRIHASLSLEYRELLSAIETEIPEIRLSKFVVIALCSRAAPARLSQDGARALSIFLAYTSLSKFSNKSETDSARKIETGRAPSYDSRADDATGERKRV